MLADLVDEFVAFVQHGCVFYGCVHGDALVAAAGRVSHSETDVGRFHLGRAGKGERGSVGCDVFLWHWTLLRLIFERRYDLTTCSLVVHTAVTL